MDRIINPIRKRLHEDYGLKTNWTPSKIWMDENDGVLEIIHGEFKEEFRVIFKREIRKYHIAQLYQLEQNLPPNLIIIGEIIDQAAKKGIIEKGVNYIDGAANMHISSKNFVIHVEGNKYEIDEKFQKGKLFNKSGLRVIFALLIYDDLINKPYRDIADYSGTALGTVNNIVNQLKINNYIISINEDTLKLRNKKKLMERWITGYEEKLKKDLFLEKCSLRNRDWRDIEFENKKALWGGEPAAEILTHYLIPTIFTIYTEENMMDLIKKYQLIPDKNGNVNVYKKFWNFETLDFHKTVPPLLIYADLLETTEPRNLETAKLIYERYLQDKVD